MVRSLSPWRRQLATLLPIVLLAAPAVAQDEIEELDEGVVMEAPFEPGIEANKWELQLQIGYLNLDQVLLEANNIIVDVENPTDVIFANMELRGENSFSPQFKLNRTFGSKFALENAVAFAVGDFQQSVSADQTKWTEETSVNTLTEEEIEAGSYFVWFHEHSVVYYPRGEGRIQPFLTAGVGTQHFFVDSAYIGDGSSALGFSYGAGLRVVGDDLYSIRLEVRNYHTSIQYDVNDNFRDDTINLTGDAIVGFPVATLEEDLTQDEIDDIIERLDLDPNQFGSLARYPRVVESFAERSYSSLWVSLGFMAAF